MPTAVREHDHLADLIGAAITSDDHAHPTAEAIARHLLDRGYRLVGPDTIVEYGVVLDDLGSTDMYDTEDEAVRNLGDGKLVRVTIESISR